MNREDPTALTRTVEELRRSEERLRLMIDAVRDYAIFMLEPDGTIASWNSGAERLKGYRPDEIIGKHFRIFYTEEDRRRQHPEEELRIALATGRYEEQGWRIRKDGSRFWANVVITALFDATGKHVGFTKVTRDFTDRQAAEEQLRQSEERLRLLVESVKDYAIFMLDPSGNVATWNAGAERLKGYSASEIIGRHFSLFYTQEDRQREHPAFELRRALADGRYEEEGWRLRKSGALFLANVVITPIYREGELLGFAKVTRDLTERRRMEEEARAAERQAAVAEARASEAQLAVKMRDEFLAIAAHELRTPLTALQLKLEGATDAVRRRKNPSPDPLEAKHLERLDGAVRQTRRLADLVERLLDVSRIMAGRLTMNVEELELARLVHDVVEDLRVTAQQSGCELSLLSPDSLVGIFDRARLEQALLNIVSNAIKYGPGKPIEVRLEGNGTGARITVRDQGIGIASDDLQRIFGRFERAAPVQHYGGLGLGLYVTRNIIEAHGGTIEVTSTPGEGSTFVVTVPSRPDLLDVPAAAED